MYELIEHKKLAADAATITFSNIPQIYTDLMLLVTARNSANVGAATVTFNTSGGTYSRCRLYGSGSQIYANTGATDFEIVYSSSTASTFSNASIYIPNYTSSSAKSYSSTSVSENNATEAYQMLIAGSWSGTDAINSVTLKTYLDSGNFTQNTSATLYGVNRTSGIGKGPLAIGGSATYVNGYWVHTFSGSSSFKPLTNLQVEYVVIAGGGGTAAGGGGAGGYRSSVTGEFSGGGAAAESPISLTAGQSYPVIVGAGGAPGASGSTSSFASVSCTGGGWGRNSAFGGAISGGSGGGWGGGVFGTGAAGVTGEGYKGGEGGSPFPSDNGGGGGGAGGEGFDGSAGNGGNGGIGVVSAITGTAIYRAGGGGGQSRNSLITTGGLGGGGNGGNAGTGPIGGSPGAQSTGSGAGGGYDDVASGGSGVVIIRYRA